LDGIAAAARASEEATFLLASEAATLLLASEEAALLLASEEAALLLASEEAALLLASERLQLGFSFRSSAAAPPTWPHSRLEKIFDCQSRMGRLRECTMSRGCPII
jgi:hypothetical protein